MWALKHLLVGAGGSELYLLNFNPNALFFLLKMLILKLPALIKHFIWVYANVESHCLPFSILLSGLTKVWGDGSFFLDLCKLFLDLLRSHT